LFDNLTVDPMHDLLEGVGVLLLKLLLMEIISKQKMNVTSMNNKIQTFNYGAFFAKTKPSTWRFALVSFSDMGFVGTPTIHFWQPNHRKLWTKMEGLITFLKIMKIKKIRRLTTKQKISWNRLRVNFSIIQPSILRRFLCISR
jgi:hypothetical protein